MVGQQTLDLFVEVRILCPQPKMANNLNKTLIMAIHGYEGLPVSVDMDGRVIPRVR